MADFAFLNSKKDVRILHVFAEGSGSRPGVSFLLTVLRSEWQTVSGREIKHARAPLGLRCATGAPLFICAQASRSTL